MQRAIMQRAIMQRAIMQRIVSRVRFGAQPAVGKLGAASLPGFRRTTTLLTLCLGLACTELEAMERITIRRDGKTRDVYGEVIVQAEDGGLLVRARDGRMWLIQAEEIGGRVQDQQPFQPLTPEALGQQMLRELPDGFRIHQTNHYVVCYNTSQVYARWVGGLFERLHRGFYNYWKNRGWNLREPDVPLVAIVFDRQADYVEYATAEIGDGAESIIGYYNMQTNRVVMYDLTGIDDTVQGQRIRSSSHIEQILSQPAAERTVATIVHEATHQLAYNSGMQTRLASNPFWLSEGLAIYFETPDVRSSRGWRTIGAVSRVSLERLRAGLPNRPADRLEKMIRDDSDFRDPVQGPAVYAESWALTYYLIKQRPKQYVEYVRRLARLESLAEPTPDERMAAFTDIFGQDLGELEQDYLRYVQRLR